MQKIKHILLWIWQFPQHLLALIILPYYNNKEVSVVRDGEIVKIKNLLRTFKYKGKTVYVYEDFPGGISLGNYILLDYYYRGFLDSIITHGFRVSTKHEYGHSRQSVRSGIFYLLIYGLPSIINNIVCRIKDKYKKKYDYYAFPTESNADKLGGVTKDEFGNRI